MQIWKLCSFHLFVLQSFVLSSSKGVNATAAKVDVGVILDLETSLGKILESCICMAIQDFYSKNSYNTVIVPHFRNSSSDVVSAASAAIDLLKNTQVVAILGPQRSIQADFVIDICDKAKVPIISPATSPFLSPQQSPYFVRSAWSSAAQAKAIAEIVKNFGWREVVIVYEDNNYGSGLVPFLTQDMLALVSNLSVVSPSAEDDAILEQLQKLKRLQTRVFIVHMLPSLASRFFKLAKRDGMMEEGYVWIIADVLTSLLDDVDSDTVKAMQGVVGVKAYYPRSNGVRSFTRRWSKWFQDKNPDMDRTELNVFGLWAYDSIATLAEGVERVGAAATESPRFKERVVGGLTDLEAIGTSITGPSLIRFIKNFTSKGLSGVFNISNGELQPSAFEIVNVIGQGLNRVGFWTENHGISKNLMFNDPDKNLGAVVWPGQVSVVPKGWENYVNATKLRVVLPLKNRVDELVKIDIHGNATGFCVDVFEEVMRKMQYQVEFEYYPYQNRDHKSFGYHYDDLVDQLYLKNFDAVVADLTITAERSLKVDFTFPYIESGVSTAVLIVDSKNAWIFMKPLTMGLWLTIGAFFVFTGFVVWALEHRVNEEFRGSPLQQVGMIFWFSFSTIVFAHKEKVKSNLSRFVVVVWLFVVLVLTSSYTASLTSMLTVQQLEPTDIRDLTKKGECVGYKEGHLVKGVWDRMNWGTTSKLKNYSSFKEYDDALTKGSRSGGVGAVLDNLPSLRLFLSKYCHKYTMIGPTYNRSGFGFAFQKGSPLTNDVSRAILQVKDSGKMDEISRKWFGDEQGCSLGNGTAAAPKSLSLDHFKGLFMISGLSSLSALAISIFVFIFKNRNVLASGASVKHKLHELAGAFDRDKDEESSKESRIVSEEMISAHSSEIKISCDEEGMFSSFVKFSSIELVVSRA